MLVIYAAGYTLTKMVLNVSRRKESPCVISNDSNLLIRLFQINHN